MGSKHHSVAGSQSFEIIIVESLLETEKGFARGPERALVVALLFDGIQSYLHRDTSSGGKQRALEAEMWIFEQESSDYVFSFEQVCEALGVNAEYLRHGLLNVKNSHRKIEIRRRVES